jgi:tRNA A37 methylthiotransferase MiaB
LGDDLGRKFREQFVGETCEVLIEDGDTMSGRCERYFIVKVKSKNEKVKNDFGFKKNQIAKVKITAVTEEGTTGEIKD